MENQNTLPDHTAVRVALWRALHVHIDAKPHVFTDEVGLQLVGDESWRSRPDMNAEFSKPMRASIVGRARFIEELVESKVNQGVTQYVILGAGLDTFAQRRPDLAAKIALYEVDQPTTQNWKRKRLRELALPIPQSLHFVPVDFEAGQSWWPQLLASGFDSKKPALVVSTGVSMYLTLEANVATLQQIANLCRGSCFAMTFMLALDLLDDQERASMEFVMKRAQEAKTPFLSLFSPEELVKLATAAGFTQSHYVSAQELYQRYFLNRADGLRAGNAEAFLLAES